MSAVSSDEEEVLPAGHNITRFPIYKYKAAITDATVYYLKVHRFWPTDSTIRFNFDYHDEDIEITHIKVYKSIV